MTNLLVRSLDGLARLCYFAGRNRVMRMSLLALCAVSIGIIGWARTARFEDTVVYTLTPNTVRSTLTNRYVSVSGQFVLEGVYETTTTIAGLISRSVRFIPLNVAGDANPLYVLDEGLPQIIEKQTVTLVGKLLEGRAPGPNRYLKVMVPPSATLFDLLNGVSVALLSIVAAGVVLTWLVRKRDYVLSIPFGLADDATASTSPRLLWFGSLGAGYGDVILRQIPVSFRAIPAEARLMPTHYPDLWSVNIRRPWLVQHTVVATSYGALPAVRIQFEDERGIMREGVIVANKTPTLKAMLDVLRFVGQ
ncbi:MAG: hypothetical protein M1546_21675 [Chloroflexi bacterium]|nr:hypothetical protein [Chloroflexota bacterium]